jgi:hypothetical protein
MWIRTQDRKILVEIKTKIEIIHDDEDIDIPIGIFNFDSGLTLLGEYKTMERALEVIDDIQLKLSEYEAFKSRNVLESVDTCFCMPLE